MSIKVCENGHFYDDRHYSVCPQCGLSAESSQHERPRVKKLVISRRANDQDMDRTISYYSEYSGNNYVTGWLVCCKGAEKGRDYRLHFGFNRVGSAVSSDICISGDPQINAAQHCAIVYDEKSNAFFITPGKGTITYLNDHLLEKPQALHAGDAIEIGSTVLRFVPYCGGDVKWN